MELEKLNDLLKNEIIQGWALVGLTGHVECAYGSLENEFTNSGDLSAQQFLAAFSFAPPNHLDILGHHLVIVRREDCFVHAVSKQRQLGVSLHSLQSGVLIISYNATQEGQRAVKDVLAAIQQTTGR